MSGASLPTDITVYISVASHVLIPDEWGKSSDSVVMQEISLLFVLIPDEWGKSSDKRNYQ